MKRHHTRRGRLKLAMAALVALLSVAGSHPTFAAEGGGRIINLIIGDSGCTFFTDSVQDAACRDGQTSQSRFFLASGLPSYKAALAIISQAFFMDMRVGFRYWTSPGDACQIEAVSVSR